MDDPEPLSLSAQETGGAQREFDVVKGGREGENFDFIHGYYSGEDATEPRSRGRRSQSWR